MTNLASTPVYVIQKVSERTAGRKVTAIFTTTDADKVGELRAAARARIGRGSSDWIEVHAR